MRPILLLVLSTIAGLGLMSCQPQPNQPVANENKAAASPEASKKTAAAYDSEAISTRLVTAVAVGKEVDVVFFNGGVRDLDLLVDLNTYTRKVRLVAVGNDLYPTDWRAKRFGISLDELTKTFWSAVNSDYSGVQATAEKLKTTLSTGKELRITSPEGTDIKVKFQAHPFFVSDGIISAEDVQKGSPAVSVYLPAGELYTTPVPGTAEGKV